MSANPLSSLTRALEPQTAEKAVGKAAKQAKEMQRMRDAAEDFESLFVTQMYQAMRRTAPPTKLFGNTQNEELFRGMLDQETANQAAHSGSFGLGESLYQQMLPKPNIVKGGKTDTGPKGR